MIKRPSYLDQLAAAAGRSPVTALIGPRQCGKTTLARMFEATQRKSVHFDLESQVDRRRLQNPEMMLGSIEGLIVLDEIQQMPELFNVLRVLADRPKSNSRFLILGSASPDLIKHAYETLAGRVQFVELSGFDLSETGLKSADTLWLRGGFPRSYLADSEEESMAWREGYIRTYLERDIPQLGLTIPAAALRRFWTMLAHYHGQTWNASELGRAMSLSDKTVRSYLDILTGTFMVRQLQPWHENIKKRQIKAPKVYLRDSGILHSLLSITDRHSLVGHPKVGASWEGMALDQALQLLRPAQAFFWGTHGGAELDLLFFHRGCRYGMEFQFKEAPAMTKSMGLALTDLGLKHIWVVYPGMHQYPIGKNVSAHPLRDLPVLSGELERQPEA
jgi:predicted AAA+ superfamily ATPase